jgi:hypothetical protein
LIRPGRKITRPPTRDLEGASVGDPPHGRPGSARGKQSPLRARLYLFSLNPRVQEAMIRKKRGIIPEFARVLRRENMRQYIATFGGPKSGPYRVQDVRVPFRMPDPGF